MEVELLSVNEAARVLGIGRTQVYRLMGTGQLRSITLGRSRKIQSRALREFVENLVKSQLGDADSAAAGSADIGLSVREPGRANAA
jgi:excisionase family DNA binding protein